MTNPLDKIIRGVVKSARPASGSSDKALPLLLGRAQMTRSFIEDEANRVADQMIGKHVTSGKAGDTKNLSGRSMKEADRLKGLTYELKPTGTVAKAKIYVPRKGDVKIAVPGDQTVSDKTLVSVNGQPIDSEQQGGAYYGLGQKHLDVPEFWKYNQRPAEMLQAKVDRLEEFYGPDRIIGSHLAMGQTSNNFAMHLADANLRAVDWSSVTPSNIYAFDRLIAKGYKDSVTGKKVSFPNWPGLADPEASMAAMKEDTALRKFFNNRFKTPSVTQPLGLPNGLDIQYAISEPRIRDMEINMTGLMAGKLVPGAKAEAAGNPHNTYTHRIEGEAIGPQEVLTPFSIDFPDSTEHIFSTGRIKDFTGTIQKVFPHQIVDDQYLDDFGIYRDRIKKLTGQKKGGAVSQDAMNLAVMNQKVQRKADAGIVRRMVGKAIRDSGKRLISDKYKAVEQGVNATGKGRIPESGVDIRKLADMLERAGVKGGYQITREGSAVSPSQYITFDKVAGESNPRQVRISNHADKYPELATGIRTSVDPATEISFEQAVNWLAKEGYPTNLSSKYKHIPSWEEHYAQQQAARDENRLESLIDAWRNKPKATRGPIPTESDRLVKEDKLSSGNEEINELSKPNEYKEGGEVPHMMGGGGAKSKNAPKFTEAFTQGLGPMLYGAARGTAAGLAGLGGDIEELARLGINYAGDKLQGRFPNMLDKRDVVSPKATLPTSERVLSKIPSLKDFGAGSEARHSEDIAAKLGMYGLSNIAAPKAGKAVVQGVNATGKALAPKAGQMAENYMMKSGMMLPMDVWHGTPHRFPPTAKNPLGEFDPMKIGTGEGAQAYGHGLYLAEVRDLAKTYQPRSPLHEEKLIKEYNRAQVKSNYPKMEVLEDAMLHKSPDEILAKFSNIEDGYTPEHAKAANEYLLWLGKNQPEVGSLYKVDLPDEQIAKMLDWDKPLSEQAPNVQAALAKIDKDTYHPQGGDYGPEELGQMIYMRLANSPLAKTKVDASELLKRSGIPGIRYLDGGSRAGGKGTSNFVVFDPKHMNIIGRE